MSIDAQVARFSFRVTGITHAVYTLFPRRHQTSRYHRGTNDGGWLLACEHHGSAYTVSSRQETCGEDDGKCDSKFFFCCCKKCYVTGLFRVVQYCTCLLELHSTRNKHAYHDDLKYHKCKASWIFTDVIED